MADTRSRSQSGSRFHRGTRRPRARPGIRSLILAGIGAFLLIGAAIVADGYYQAYQAYKDAAGVFPELQQARGELAEGKVPTGDTLAQASGLAAMAQSRLDHARFTLQLTGALPFLGRPVDAVRYGVQAAGDEAQAATTVRSLVADLLGAGALKGSAGGQASAPVFHDGAINVKLVESLAPRMDTLLGQLRAGDAAIRAIPSVPFFRRAAELKAQALSESTQALRLAERADSAFRVLPSFLGSTGPTTYFLALQNNADQRGTGGAVLAYALVHIRNGKISLESGGPINNIDNALHGVRVPLPPGVAWYVRAAHVNPRINNGANYSPNFPDVARTWVAMVQRSTGTSVNGAIAMDPQAVAQALSPEKPIRIPSYPGRITADNVVQITEHDQYALPRPDQYQFPGQLVAAAFRSFTNPKDVTELVRQLGAALADKRVQLWSADPRQQALLHELSWDGGLMEKSGDYLYLTQNKRIANKVDYFAHQSIHYTVDVLPSGAVRSSYAVTLSSKVPQNEPLHVVGPWSPYGLNLAMMNLYVPKRARFGKVEPAGPFPHTIRPWSGVSHVRPTGFAEHVEGRFRVFTKTLVASPGHPATVTFTYTVPGVIQRTGAGGVYQLTLQHQPMASPADVTVTVHLPDGSTVQSAYPGWLVDGTTATFRTSLTRDVVTRIVF